MSVTPLPAAEPCIPWEMDTGCCGEEWANLEPELQERATALAWSTMRVLSAGQLGVCPVTVRPCLTAPCNACMDTWMRPTLMAGVWVNNACGTVDCSCARLCEVVLGGRIALITRVVLDGDELPLGDFRIDNGNRIVRQDGECWPSCQDMTKPLGAVGTLGITYIPGVVPDSAALWAVGTLACEFAKSCMGGKCRLPTSVTNISRQGVTFNLDQSAFPGGKTGIREVDAVLQALNPSGKAMGSHVWSPDVPWAKHRWTSGG
jgi:hypothetical protein